MNFPKWSRFTCNFTCFLSNFITLGTFFNSVKKKICGMQRDLYLDYFFGKWDWFSYCHIPVVVYFTNYISGHVCLFSFQIVDGWQWWLYCKHHCGHEERFPMDGVSLFLFFATGVDCLKKSWVMTFLIHNHIFFYKKGIFPLPLQIKQQTSFTKCLCWQKYIEHIKSLFISHLLPCCDWSI